MRTAQEWIDALQLQPHPEGGHYREVYRSPETIPPGMLPARYAGPRSFGTSIYFLLRAGERSRFHRLQSDEIWYHHAGGTGIVHQLLEDGSHRQEVIGPSQPQVVIPRGRWFGALVQTGDYLLVGCAVFPGFDFADFELARPDALLSQYPQHAGIIRQLA